MRNLLSSRVRWKLLKYTVSKQRNFLIIFTLLLSITFPVPVFVKKLTSPAFQMNQYNGAENNYLILLSLMTIALLTIVPFLFFNYLTTKKSVDFIHSLPISRKDLWATNTVASFMFVLVPFTIAYWTGQIAVYSLFDITYQMSHLIYYLRSILFFFALMAPTIFVIMNTGTTSDSIIYTIILFVAPFIIYGAFEIFSSMYVIGFSSFSSSNILAFMSPAYAYFFSVNDIFTPNDINFFTAFWIFGSIFVYSLIIKLYNSWKSEKSEEPFNNPVFFPFVTSLFIAFLLIFSMSLFSLDTNSRFKFLALQNLIIPILFTYIVFAVLDFIRLRNIRQLKVTSKRYLVILVTTLSLATLAFITQGFGYAWNLPERDRVNSVSIEVWGGSNPLFQEYFPELQLDSKDDIDEIYEIHQDIVNELKKQNGFFPDVNLMDDNSNNYSFTIKYKLANGRTQSRNFTLSDKEVSMFASLFNVKEYIYKTNPILDPITEIKELQLFNATMNKKISISEADLITIRTLYWEDFNELNKDFIFQSSESLNYVILYGEKDAQSKQLNIDGNFPRLSAFLDEKEIIGNTDFTFYVSSADTDLKYYSYGYSKNISNYNYDYDAIQTADLSKLTTNEVNKYNNLLQSNNITKTKKEFYLIALDSEDGFMGDFITFPIKK